MTPVARNKEVHDVTILTEHAVPQQRAVRPQRAPRRQGAPRDTGLRVVIVHDYLTQRGGAERVVLALLKAFPGARLVTSVYNPETTFPEFGKYDIERTWLDRVPAFRADPRRALPLLPAVFSGIRLDDVDLVICSSSGWAHGVQTTATKLVYCHTPARWLHVGDDYLASQGRATKAVMAALTPYLRWWDRRAERASTAYFANSSVVADRISSVYGRSSHILAPPITLDSRGEQHPMAGIEPGFLLAVSRPRGYKHTAVVCEAVAAMPGERLVVVGGLPAPEGERSTWPATLTGVTDVSDAELRWLYANCSALVTASHEDFGLTPLEANTFGKPAVVLRAGGFLDTLVEGTTGTFINELSSEAVQRAVRELRGLALDPQVIAAHGERYSLRSFARTLHDAAYAAADPAGPIDSPDSPSPQLHAARANLRWAIAALLSVGAVLASLVAATTT